MSKQITENTPIWKKETCLAGQCRGTSLKHKWSLPTCYPSGLMVECLLCHKLRTVHLDAEEPEFKVSEYVTKRLKTLEKKE